MCSRHARAAELIRARVDFPGDINRALLGFEIGAAQVFTDHSDAGELQASQKHDCDEDGSVAGEVPSQDEGSQHEVGSVREGQERYRGAQISPEAQGRRAETRNAFEGQVPEFP